MYSCGRLEGGLARGTQCSAGGWAGAGDVLSGNHSIFPPSLEPAEGTVTALGPGKCPLPGQACQGGQRARKEPSSDSGLPEVGLYPAQLWAYSSKLGSRARFAVPAGFW